MSVQSGTRAVVLSGGGAEGAYEVGVLKALCTGASWVTEHRPLDPTVFTGTSIGSFNAAFLVSHWERHGPDAVALLEQVWIERLATDAPSCGNGVYRYRADPLSLLDPRCYVPNPLRPWLRLFDDGTSLAWEGLQRAVHALSAREESIEERLVELVDLSSFVSREPWQQALRELIDYAAIRRSPLQLRIPATNWATGELRIYHNHEMTDQLGPQILLASSAIPGFFRPENVGALPFVDGGVLLNTPLKPALQAGADVIHMVYLDPDISAIGLPHQSNTFEMLYRMQQIQWAGSVNDDIEDAETINKGLAILARVSGGGEVRDDDLRTFIQVASKIRDRMEKGSPYRPLTVYRYHPRDPLGGTRGFLNMRRDHLVSILERGYADAVYHDCEASEDVLPNPQDRQHADTVGT
jgi:predicted acylesterase/phospholipase RssA